VVRAVIKQPRRRSRRAARPVLFSQGAFGRGYQLDKVHFIVESERLRDMLEYAFVEGVAAQREVDEKRPDRPLLMKERRKDEAIAKLLSEPGPLALKWDVEKQRWEVI
jgi:hypothetical protein